MIHLVSDSSCDLPDEIIKELDIHIAPLNILIQDKVYVEKVDLTPREFYKRMEETEELPKTSQPTPESFMTLFDELTKTGEVLCITISAGLSGTYQTAQMIADSYNGKVTVYNTRAGSLGHGLIILKAAQLIKEGRGMEEIIAELTAYSDRITIIIILNTLDNIVKGGRLSKFKGTMGKLLDFRAILRNDSEGKVILLKKVRGKKNLLKEVSEEIRKVSDDFSDIPVGITSYNNAEDTEYFKSYFENELNARSVLINDMGATMATYAGEGGMIISF